ncbi:hypothetical protein [Streptomyces sp. NPDC002785]|uniref:YqeB family protein n=1 Tax=Streptomyces sp. NPDC002785 TaxID=3154543 RepID=UPI00331C781D
MRDVTVVRHKKTDRLLVAVGFPLLGTLAGWLVKLLANWAASWPWVPWEGPVDLINNAPEPWVTVVSLLVGLTAGIVIVLLAEDDYVTVTIENDRVTVARGNSTQRVSRTAVHGVFADAKRLVVLGVRGEELAVQNKSEGADLPGNQLIADAFRAHGYPWLPDGDPYECDYQRWVEDLPGQPVGSNALFKARERALEKDDKKNVAELREELAKLGVVVRDTDKRQWWRRVQSANGTAAP